MLEQPDEGLQESDVHGLLSSQVYDCLLDNQKDMCTFGE